ncbi:hypothetical protein [Flagellimonas aurea]|uniref:hypothetical protein n=1 Tax=Flagellimonas aurea TaxID=2915619 RepID=UPI0035CEEBE7
MKEILEFFTNDSITTILIGTGLAAMSSVILRYLNSSKEFSKIFKKEIEDLKEKQVELNDLKKRKSLENLIKTSITDKEKEAYLLQLYENQINKRIQEIDDKLKQEYENINNPETYRLNELKNNFNLIRKRLLNEIASLSKRANLNLTVGILSSIIAIGFLFYSGVYTNLDFDEKWFNFITYFIPKLSLLLFLGTFSFYFLNLYKSNLGVIQSYQSELNSVDFKIVSIVTIILSADENRESNLKELISQISLSQWNGVLKSGETTVELQKMKESNSFDKELLFKLWTMNQLFQKEDKKN